MGEFNQNQEAIARRSQATRERYTPRTEREKGEAAANVAKRSDREDAEKLLRTFTPAPVAAKQAQDYKPGLAPVLPAEDGRPRWQRTSNP
jgi:hypothetical protein